MTFRLQTCFFALRLLEELVMMSLLLFFVCCIFIPLASAQPGFLNIACGSKTNYTDERGLKWVADAPYVGNVGQAKATEGINSTSFKTYRSFPKPNRACYTLPVNASEHYFLRLFWEETVATPSGDFIVFIQSKGTLFKFHAWDASVDRDCELGDSYYYKEWILTPNTNDLHICFAIDRAAGIDPNIYGIQLRELPMEMHNDIMIYSSVNSFLLEVHRRDYGNNKSSIRYPDDKFDRIWEPDCRHSDGIIHINNACSYCAPDRVLQTTNTDNFLDSTKPDGGIVYVITPTGIAKQKGLLDSKTNDSVSAVEYFYTPSLQQGTDTKDVNALSILKGSLKLAFKSWIADPCCGLPWERIQCDINEKNVVSLNLSGLQLHGSIPDMIGNLSSLQTLHIESNNFSGHLPNWLTKLENLEELFISYNNFTGEIPSELLSLKTFRYEGNNLIYTSTDTPRKTIFRSDNNVHLATIYVTSIAIPILSLVLVLVVIKIRRRRSTKAVVKSNLFHTIPNLAKLRRFNGDEMISTTQNFSSIIGHGGFGKVFHGTLHNVGEIAVKVLSTSSNQGEQEFLNELDLLSKVNHKNLVRVIGYCNETDQFMIVYEYMCKGSLADYLHGSKSESSELNWRYRLQIALGAAVGLEYLHIHCKPKIIHRDLKSSNILLDNNFNCKLSDLGISKALMEEASCVTTNVKGTYGYLDPEYFNTRMLTEKTDIYSFGVVLLEIIFARKPIDTSFPKDRVALAQWVINQNAHGDKNQEYIQKIIPFIDDRIRNQINNMESMMLVMKLAINCIQMKSSFRPCASGVVERLKEALEQEIGEDMHFPQGTEMQYVSTSMNENIILEDYTLETLTLER